MMEVGARRRTRESKISPSAPAVMSRDDLDPILRLPRGCEDRLPAGAIGLVGYFDAANEDDNGKLPHEAAGRSLADFLRDVAAHNQALEEKRRHAAPKCIRRYSRDPRLICCECGGTKSADAFRCRACSVVRLVGASRPRDPLSGRFVRVHPQALLECDAGGPRCLGRKAARARTCWNCYVDRGGHGGRRHVKRLQGRNTKINQAVLDQARDLYESGMSLRAVARAVLHRTGYKNTKSAASSIDAMFRARGWRLRDQRSATAAANRTRARR